ncbi:unnamed protein product [Bursaphelenchus xylophilus]|uniref:(pine wood nematode) hypothetical protein n=1 Tax=Bursaphelenchus xylophilus TaxID=6326 RepID=A0A1I7SUZ0_BURXY|nr:unnamed protein product [Bursaphelenchus xylophilus]CAG9100631.1 unnamed protein product [Bursaphelenchus xylophilus]
MVGSLPRDQVSHCRKFHGATNPYYFPDRLIIPGAVAAKTGKVVPLSPQELISCTTNANGNDGCNGGYLDLALKYVKEEGLSAAKSSPFVSSRGRIPQCQVGRKVGKIKNYKQIPKRREDLMQRFLYNQGPLSVTIDARQLRHYKHGVLRPRKPAGGWQINHAVTILGYGEEKVPFWIVKNSWGTEWGEKGFFRLLRGQNSLAIGQESYVAFVSNEN